VRQLEQAALAWLRHPAHSLTLRQLVGRNTAADYRQALALNAAWRRARKGRRRPRQCPGVVTQTAIQKREANPKALARFVPAHLALPLQFPRDPDLPPSPKPRYRSHYRYLGPDGLDDPQTLDTLSDWDLALRLFDYTNLEPFLAAHIYVPSAKGQGSFHPVSLYLLRVYRREHHLSRHAVLRRLRHQQDGRELRRRLGFDDF